MKKLLLILTFTSLTTMPMQKIAETELVEEFSQLINQIEWRSILHNKKTNTYTIREYTINEGFCRVEQYTQAEAASKFNEFKNLYIAQQKQAAE